MELQLSPEDLAAAARPLLAAVAAQIAAQLAAAARVLAEDAQAGFLDKEGAAKYLGLEVRALENWMRPVREGGRGLPHLKLGATVRFQRARIDAWALSLEVNPPLASLKEAA